MILTILIILSFCTTVFVTLNFAIGPKLSPIWYKYQLGRCTRKSRLAKARWLSIKQTIQKGSGSTQDPLVIAEGKYCDALIRLRTYEKLLSMMSAVVEKGDIEK